MSFRPSGRVAALIAAAVILVVLVLGWVVFISPQSSKAAALGGQIDDTRTQIASTQAYISDPATRRNLVEAKRLNKVLPDSPEVSQILRQLNTAARAARVSITSLSPSVPVSSSGAEAMPIALTVSGHYFGISKFLKILRTQVGVHGSTVHGSGRLYSVDSIQFTGGGSGAATGANGQPSASTITAALALNAFIYGTGVPVTPVATPTTTTP